MSLTDRILRVANCKALKGLLGRVNTRLRPRRPVRFRILGRTVYAASLDRIAALMLWLRGGSHDFEIGLWRSLIRPGSERRPGGSPAHTRQSFSAWGGSG